MTKKRNAFFYKIHNREGKGYGDVSFEDILTDIMSLKIDDRRWQHKLDDPESFMRLVSFERLRPDIVTSKCYAGVIAVYGNTLTAGSLSSDELEYSYKLPDGKLPSEVVHFLYYADKKVLVLEYHRNAASNVKILAYVNYLVSSLGLSQKVAFIGEIVCHPDAIELIKKSHRIKSVKTVVSRESVQSNNHLKQLLDDIFGAKNISSHLDTLGSVGIVLTPRKGKFLSSGRDVDAYRKAFPDVKQQVYNIEIEEGMEIASINILQPKFKNEVIMPESKAGQKEYASAIFSQLETIYQNAGEII